MSSDRRLGFITLTAMVVTLGTSCGNSDSNRNPITTPPNHSAVTITPGALDFDALGLTADLSATVTDPQGRPISNPQLTWSALHGRVIEVTPTGTVTAKANGTDSVVATVNGTKGYAIVRVEQVPTALEILPAGPTLSVLGLSDTLKSQLVDRTQHPLMPVWRNPPVSWTSSDPSVVSIDASGTLLANGVGTTTITSTRGAFSSEVTATVQLDGPVGPAIVGQEMPCTGGFVGPFPCDHVSLLAYLPLGGLGIRSQPNGLNDLWGWTDPSNGKEYALVGRHDGTAFIDLSTPTKPRYVGWLPSHGPHQSTWRDVKVYHNYAFIVADSAGNHGMQVFDLTQLRGVSTPKLFRETARYADVGSAQNIAINEESGFAYIVGVNSFGKTCGGGLHMVDIHDPVHPTFAGCFADPATGIAGTGYTHDVQCVIYHGPDATHDGREICFGSNETALSIADVTDKSAPVALSHASYPGVGYASQGWLTTDQHYFLMNDELDELNGTAGGGTRTLIWDVSDLTDPVLVGQYHGPTTATDHNHYVVGSRLYASNYQFGIRVLDISDPVHPTQLGFFDTAPELPNTPGFGGSWSNYPFFASGIVVVTSGAEGLFVLRAN